jgi:hypothetical protein
VYHHETVTGVSASIGEPDQIESILCIDEERICAAADLPVGAQVVRFRRRIDPASVLRVVDG